MDFLLVPPNPPLRKSKASLWTTRSLQLWKKCGFDPKVRPTLENLGLPGLQQQEAQLEVELQEEQVWRRLLWVGWPLKEYDGENPQLRTHTLTLIGKSALEGDVVSGLQVGLARVRPPTIGEWNLHKHVRGDRELRPIFIPF